MRPSRQQTAWQSRWWLVVCIFHALLVQANAGLKNVGFTVSDTESAAYGWTTSGNVVIGGGTATLTEDGVHLPTHLAQHFVLKGAATHLRITIQSFTLAANGSGQPADAFQIALLDGNGNSLVPVTSQGNTTAFFSVQQDGQVWYGNTTTVPGATGSGNVWSPQFPVTLDLDITTLTADQTATLSMDLLGIDTFGSSVTLAGIQVQGIEPTAQSDAGTTLEDVAVSINVLANDTSNSGSALAPASVTVVSAPAHGMTGVDAQTGEITYSPTPNYSGSDSFTYTVADSDGNRSAAATVSLTVTAVNDAPTFDSIGDLNLQEDAARQTVSLSGISAGAGESQALAITAVSSNPGVVPHPDVNYVSANAAGSLTFSPVANASGTATITVTLKDDGGTANGGVDTVVRTFTVNVAAVNDAPVLDAVADQFVTPGQAFSLMLSANDVDVGSAGLQFSLVSGPSGLAVSAAGLVEWNVPTDSATTTNRVVVQVSDDGVPAMSSMRGFDIVIMPKPVLTITHTDGGMLLQWASVPGFRYQLQFATSLTTLSWSNLGSEQTATGGSLSFLDTDAANHTARFYILRVRP